jgi:hypothetical protein
VRQATITRTTFLGNCIHIAARLESGEEAVAEVSREEALLNNGTYRVGEPIHIWWKHEDEMRF